MWSIIGTWNPTPLLWRTDMPCPYTIAAREQLRQRLTNLLNEYQVSMLLESLAKILMEQAIKNEKTALLDAKVSLELAHKEKAEAVTLRLAANHVFTACKTITPRDMNW